MISDGLCLESRVATATEEGMNGDLIAVLFRAVEQIIGHVIGVLFTKFTPRRFISF